MFSEDTKPDLNTNLVYSIERHHHQKRILTFLQNSLPGFARQLIEATDFSLSNMCEDNISREIVNLLNDRIRESSGYLFRFETKSGPDILIYALPYAPFSSELLIIEAKRLPPTSSRDYVHTGIGRFKREEHGKEHEIAAILGYVQDKDFAHWHKMINSWIDDLIRKVDEFPAWIEKDKLSRVKESNLGEYESKHSRVSKDQITLRHFWVMLNSTKAN